MKNRNLVVTMSEFESNVLRGGHHIIYFHKENGGISSYRVPHGSPSHERVRRIAKITRVDREFRCTTFTSRCKS